jgi:spore maturation protein CgeB
VYDGLLYGLQQHGAQVIQYRLDQRIQASDKSLHALWRIRKRADPDLPKPNRIDMIFDAGCHAVAMALRHQVDVVLVVSAMFLHPDVILMMKRAGLRVVVLFTESPYDHAEELKIASMVDGGWTNERAVLKDFRAVNPNSGYLPHAWHPLKHTVGERPGDEQVPSHDVVFVGSGFPERIAWFNAIDWTGIDLGLYGTWKALGLNRQVRACVKGDQVSNEVAGALYRRAKIGMNLYRTRGSKRLPLSCVPESLSPRAYELAACGAFHLSEYRAEVREVFGETVPTFSTPSEAAALIRVWLKDEARRLDVAAQLPARVAAASWVERAKTVLGDLQRLLQQRAAA